MLKVILIALIPILGLLSDGLVGLFTGQRESIRSIDTGTLEKMIVANASVAMELDLSRLDGTGGKESRQTALLFDAERDSFFTILVYNGELRTALPGSLPLKPKGPLTLPTNLNDAYERLVVERTEFGSDYALVVRDAKTGFVFFNVVGQSSAYEANQHMFRSQGGRLLLSHDFANQLGRPSSAGLVVGQLSIAATMRTIEATEIVNGEVRSNALPSSPETGTVPGPDVVVGNLFDLSQWGSNATQVGLAVGTDSCNFGVENLHWFANPANDHPVIPQNLYRMSGGAGNDERFEQIGLSSVKHAFTALTENICGLGCNGVGGSNLGSGCSDPYSADLNEGPSLGSRAWINPFTGAYPRNDDPDPAKRNNNHSGHNHSGVAHRIITEISDLNTSLNAGATYYAEAQYVTPHEYVWCQANPTQCNMYNNVSYRRYNVTGTASPFSFLPAASTVRSEPAINAWPGATRVEIKPDPGNDGVAKIAYKVTNPSAGVWHYEYAIYNENLDRSIQSFSVPIGSGVTLSNIGFHAPPQHPGTTFDGTVGNTGFSSTPWTQTQTATAMTWNSETFAQNQNANSIRWGTLYNFRFDSNRPPQTNNATIGFFKTGTPATVQVQAPSVPSATFVSVSGRVTTSGWRGIGYARITITDSGGNTRTAYTNSFGYYRLDDVTAGATYTIAVTKKRYSFTPQQLQINDNLQNVNFIAN